MPDAPNTLLTPGRAVYVTVREGAVLPGIEQRRQDFIVSADPYGLTIRTCQAASVNLPNEYLTFYPWANVLRIEPDARRMVWAASWEDVPE